MMNSLDLIQQLTIGDYILRVRIHNYSNPSSVLANSSCCDYPCGEPSCDNIIFHYCLRSLGTRDGRLHCSDVNYDDAPLNFSQPISLGLLNPLSIQGPWTVSHNNGTRAHIPHVHVHDFAIVVY